MDCLQCILKHDVTTEIIVQKYRFLIMRLDDFYYTISRILLYIITVLLQLKYVAFFFNAVFNANLTKYVN